MLSNTGWLFTDKVVRIGIGVVLGIWLARTLGPTRFGIWSYATAFTYLFSAFATLGLDSIVIRELVRHPTRHREILGSACGLRLVAGTSTCVLASVAIMFIKRGDSLTLWLVAISAAGFIFQSFSVIDLYFQARIESRFTVYAANAAFLLTALVKIWVLSSGAGLVAFAWASLGEVVLTAVFLVIAYRVQQQRLKQWTFDATTARSLLRDSWPLVFSGMAVGIFMKIDQVMIEALLDSRAVGIYSVAVRVSELWYFVGSVVISSVAPTIYRARSDGRDVFLAKLQRVFSVMLWLAILISLSLSFFSTTIIRAFFGAAYVDAGPVLLIHTWSTLFVFIGLAQGIFWIAEDLQAFSLLITVAAAVLNIGLNLVLIPRLGVSGAAIATLLSYGVPTILMPAVLKQSRPMFLMFFRSFVLLPRL
jgi:Membrane protein involved in the export of O-antigen and teichoic acid